MTWSRLQTNTKNICTPSTWRDWTIRYVIL